MTDQPLPKLQQIPAAIAAVIVIIVFALDGLIKDAFKGTCDTVNSGSFSHTASSC